MTWYRKSGHKLSAVKLLKGGVHIKKTTRRKYTDEFKDEAVKLVTQQACITSSGFKKRIPQGIRLKKLNQSALTENQCKREGYKKINHQIQQVAGKIHKCNWKRTKC